MYKIIIIIVIVNVGAREELAVGFFSLLPPRLCSVEITSCVAQWSPAWHRAARRKRARARLYLRHHWPAAPCRTMAAAGLLHLHHGSTVPATVQQQWTCSACDETNPILATVCRQCTYPTGLQKPPPPGMWRCPCGMSTSLHVRFCRSCQTSFGHRLRFPQHVEKRTIIFEKQSRLTNK